MSTRRRYPSQSLRIRASYRLLFTRMPPTAQQPGNSLVITGRSPAKPLHGHKSSSPSPHTMCHPPRHPNVKPRNVTVPAPNQDTNPSRTLPRMFKYSRDTSVDPHSDDLSDTRLKFPKPLLLPPKVTVWNRPDLVRQTPGLPKTVLTYIIGVIAFGLLVGISAVIIGRIVSKKVGTDRLVLPNLPDFTNCRSRKKTQRQDQQMKTSTIISPQGVQNHQVIEASTRVIAPSNNSEKTLLEGCAPSSLLDKEAATSLSSRLSLHTMQNKFDERCIEEEADIALALQFALREQSSPVIIADGACQPLGPFNASFEIDDIFTKMSLRAGLESAGKRTGMIRTWPSSDSEESEFETLSSASSSDTMSSNASDSSEDDGDKEVNDPFELKIAQSQSMGVKKGMLVSWLSCDSLEKAEKEISKVPTVVISGASPILRSPYLPGSLSSSSSSLDSLLRPPLPSLIITSPSMNSLPSIPSSTSSDSVDLNDFPIPPSEPTTDIVPISTEIDSSPLFQKRDLDAWSVDAAKASAAENRRSTLAQLLMMYTIA